MIQSDENDCPSLSSSTESETFSDNNKSIEKVSKLFSNLFGNSETAYNVNYKSITSPKEDIVSRRVDVINPVSESVKEVRRNVENVETTVTKETTSNSVEPLPAALDDAQSPSREYPSLAVSTNTVVLDKRKNSSFSGTPCSSKIPVFHSRNDEVKTSIAYHEERRGTGTCTTPSLKFVGGLVSGSLRRICSSSRIPVSTRRLHLDGPNGYLASTPATENFCCRRQQHPKNSLMSVQKRTEKSGMAGKYNHVKSKLAAYIHRPLKTECVRLNSNRSSASPVEKRMKSEELYTNMRRMNSKTSLDTYICCDYKPAPISDLACFELDDLGGDSHERIRKHFELAIEHRKLKLEKERTILEYRRAIVKEQQLVLEHSEKANDCMQKAAALLLSRITDKT